jgi:hypothetical protein
MKTLNVFVCRVLLPTGLVAIFLSPGTTLAQTNVTTSTGITQGQPVAATGNPTVTSDPAYIDAVAYNTSGTDISAMINAVYTNTTVCPSANGCVIDARGATGSQLVMNQNPFAGRNVRVKLLLGNFTYVACVPWVVPQTGVIVEGSGLTGSTAIGTIIRAGKVVGDGCLVDFPGSGAAASLIQTSWQHGPFAANPTPGYSAVIQDGSPSQLNDKFGSQWRFLTVDAKDLADFCFFSSSMEEKSGVFHFGCRGAVTACGFWDRAFQIGSPTGGSGPTHFNIFDTTCDISSGTNNQTRGWVYEGARTFITLSGGNCTAAPHAYPVISSTGHVTSATITYKGTGCSNVTPPSCAVNTAVGVTTTATCTTSVDGSGAVTAVNITNQGAGYPFSNRGGGPWIERSTLRGTGTSNQMADALWLEGSYDAHISDIHCEWLGTNPNDPIYSGILGGPANCVNFGGSGNAQNSAGRIENVDVGNNGGGGQVVHLAAGGVSGAAPSNQGTSLANIAFEAYSGTATTIQDDTAPSTPVDSACTGCLVLSNSGNGVVPQYISGWGTGRVALRVLSSAFSTTSTTLATVGPWVWTVQANKSYAVSCRLSYQAASGGGLTIGAGGAGTAVWLGANVATAAGAFTNTVLTTGYGSISTTVGTPATNFVATFDGQITVSSTSGTLQVQAASTSTMKNLTINPGSWCRLDDAN